VRSWHNSRWGYRDEPRVLAVHKNRNGYISANVRQAGHNQTRRTVHRLVGEAFLGPLPEGMETRHLNGDGTDNRLENLAYGTHKENMADQRVHGTLPLGDRKPLSKLSYIKAKAVRTLYASNGFAYSELAEVFGVDDRTIRRIISGEYWREEDAPKCVSVQPVQQMPVQL
jgi:hypothetical protein